MEKKRETLFAEGDDAQQKKVNVPSLLVVIVHPCRAFFSSCSTESGFVVLLTLVNSGK